MSDQTGRIIVCAVGESFFALPLELTAEVIEDARVSPIPCAPPQLSDAVNVHGRIVPVLDVALLLGNTAVQPGRTILVLDPQVADLALRVGMVTGIAAMDGVERREGELPMTDGELLLPEGWVPLLSVARLVDEIETMLST